MQWPNPTVLDRLRLRRAALRYAAHGWAVLPGARLAGHRFDCDRPGCPILGCHPAMESGVDDASTDAARVARWWRRRSHSVLLVTGLAFDVVEVPATLGLRVLGTARLHADVLGHEYADVRGPVAVTPDGRWMFLVRPGRPLRPELERCLDVVRHGPGSWIPAAPSRIPEGPVRWAVPPEQVRWRLPESDRLQALLVDALDMLGRRPATTVRPVTVPRQMSTARRSA
jgi:hypothetical protein